MVEVTLSDVSKKKMLTTDYMEWLRLNYGYVLKWMYENLEPASYGDFLKILKTQPFVIYMVIRQARDDNYKKINEVVRRISKPGHINMIIGAKRSGKTTFGFYLCSKIANHRDVWWFGPPCELPPFFKGSTMEYNNLPQDVHVVIDEASVQFLNRTSNQQIDVIQMLPIIGHSGRSFTIITQSTAISDINFFKLTDSLIFKTFTTIQSETERFKVSDELRIFMPRRINEFLYYDNEDIYTGKFTLPNWWTEKYSTPYGVFKDNYEMFKFIIKSLKDMKEDTQIVRQVQLKGRDIDEMIVGYIRMLAEVFGEETLLNLPKNELVSMIEKGYDDTSLLEEIEGKSTGIISDFKLSPIEEEEKLRNASDKTIQLYSRRKANGLIINDLMQRVKHGRNAIISIYGPTGSGKSYSGIQIANIIQKLYKKQFNTNNICYSSDELMKAAREAKQQDTLLFDEQSIGGGFGSGSGRSISELQMLEETIRKKQINLIFISPELKTHNHNFILRTWGINRERKRSKLIVSTPKNDILGYIIVKMPPKQIIKEYEIKKDNFLNNFLEGKYGSRGHKEMAESVIKHPKWQIAKTIRAKKALVQMIYPNLSLSEVDTVLGYCDLLDE